MDKLKKQSEQQKQKIIMTAPMASLLDFDGIPPEWVDDEHDDDNDWVTEGRSYE